jgi:hypothetical protein
VAGWGVVRGQTFVIDLNFMQNYSVYQSMDCVKAYEVPSTVNICIQENYGI